MACGDIVWAMPPNPACSYCLAREHLLHLALWHRHAVPVRAGGARVSSAGVKLAKVWLQHGCV
eukprot:279179-Amphidinium_carterae.1